MFLQLTIQIQNDQAGIFRAVFNKPVVNPLVAFASVGGVVSVPVEASRPFTPIWTDSSQGNTAYQNPANATQYNRFVGTEGFNIIRIDGTMTEVTLITQSGNTIPQFALGLLIRMIQKIDHYIATHCLLSLLTETKMAAQDFAGFGYLGTSKALN